MSVKYNFEGKRVLVTGAAKGLGEAIVAKFVLAGAQVFALDRDEEKLEELKVKFPQVETLIVDLLDWEETQRAVLSLAPVDHLVNNAGVADPAYFDTLTEASIDRTFGINFKAYVSVGQAFAKGITTSEDGKCPGRTIVNVSSVLDEKTLLGVGMYSCSKAAVSMLTKSMAMELADKNIRVNSVRPTVMRTSLISFPDPVSQTVAAEVVNLCMSRQVTKKLCTVEETAEVVLYLSSEASSMVNGSSVLVDGGLYTS